MQERKNARSTVLPVFMGFLPFGATMQELRKNVQECWQLKVAPIVGW
jgi:hypothetical protein